MPFDSGDEVLVLYRDILYDAKIKRAKLHPDNVWRYNVHYKGWNNSYDEWVGEDKLLHRTSENLKLQRRALREARKRKQNEDEAQQAAQRLSNSSKNENSKDVRRSVENPAKIPQTRAVALPADVNLSAQTMEPPPPKGPSHYVAVQILIPRTLRKKLLDHHNLITTGKLTKLPRKPNVDDVFQLYPSHREGEDEALMAMELTKRLRFYFNSLLEPMLLYREERRQYSEAITLKNNVEPCVVYGAEHLLRLFVKLPCPELLNTDDYSEDELSLLESELHDFLRFMEDRAAEIFE